MKHSMFRMRPAAARKDATEAMRAEIEVAADAEGCPRELLAILREAGTEKEPPSDPKPTEPMRQAIDKTTTDEPEATPPIGAPPRGVPPIAIN